MSQLGVLVLEGGVEFHGRAVGHLGRASGVMVPYAGISGFPEVMTDPSYRGKMFCFTYPHIGNAGVNPEDLQSDRVHAAAAVMREASRVKANRLGEETFDEFLKRCRIPGVEGVDTRAVTRLLVERGPLAAAVGTGRHADPDELRKLLDRAREPSWSRADFTVDKPFVFTHADAGADAPRWKVVVYDFGVKRGFLRRLAGMGCSVTVVPPDYPAGEALAKDVDGVVLSAGPGLPMDDKAAVGVAAALIGERPLWGVGYGAGLIAAALGVKIAVDGRGHHGSQPVGRRDEPSGEMTMQCHDFWIDQGSLAEAELEMSHFHLNDKTVEGFESEKLKLMGQLFHPEAEPGSRDSLYLFDLFGEMLHGKRKKWFGIL